jgi:hypothetical protein
LYRWIHGCKARSRAALERYGRRYAHSSSRVRLNRSTLPLVCGLYATKRGERPRSLAVR